MRLALNNTFFLISSSFSLVLTLCLALCSRYLAHSVTPHTTKPPPNTTPPSHVYKSPIYHDEAHFLFRMCDLSYKERERERENTFKGKNGSGKVQGAREKKEMNKNKKERRKEGKENKRLKSLKEIHRHLSSTYRQLHSSTSRWFLHLLLLLDCLCFSQTCSKGKSQQGKESNA